MGKITSLARKARKQKLLGLNKADKNVIIITEDEKQHKKGALTIVLYSEKENQELS